MFGAIDKELWEKEVVFCGIDEVGRGSLAGPVVACAIILKPNSVFPGLKDSKRLSAQQREKFYKIITKSALAFSIGKASNKEIDRLNIQNATFLAMERAVLKILKKIPECKLALIDGPRAPSLPIKVQTIVKGDEKSISIACASIVAKVKRDRLMKILAQRYPEYHFEVNKGYPTQSHRAQLIKIGPSEVHRQSFGILKLNSKK
ncbi:MAG: ribonuclease HII [candidate division WOR-3 bacterium]|nr:ribonuclease HII [candidate division WOR-3 bacterium]MCX7757945.1 ribonuclease HII [candidate division WOR-3 bacterium]MDW7987292.1 ribonuclease HII [candidate division WOR-3 bacterium]